MTRADLRVRQAAREDVAELNRLYADAFPDEDLRPLVGELSALGEGVLSLIAETEDRGGAAGHVMFTLCALPGGVPVALLGPLAVAPQHQRQGVGRALVTAGHDEMRNLGVAMVCVLGDPAYYGRLGFHAERQVLSPFPLPPEWDGAWHSLRLAQAGDALTGQLAVPEPWKNPALWSP